MAKLWVHSSEIFLKINVQILRLSHTKLALSFQPCKNPVLIKWDSKISFSQQFKTGQSHIMRKDVPYFHMLFTTASSLGKLSIKNQKVLPIFWVFLRAKVMTLGLYKSPHGIAQARSTWNTPIAWNELWGTLNMVKDGYSRFASPWRISWTPPQTLLITPLPCSSPLYPYHTILQPWTCFPVCPHSEILSSQRLIHPFIPRIKNTCVFNKWRQV